MSIFVITIRGKGLPAGHGGFQPFSPVDPFDVGSMLQSKGVVMIAENTPATTSWAFPNVRGILYVPE